MIYLFRIFSAVFVPTRLQAKIRCTHEGTSHSHLIDLGRNKRFWCTACDAVWYATGGAW